MIKLQNLSRQLVGIILSAILAHILPRPIPACLRHLGFSRLETWRQIYNHYAETSNKFYSRNVPSYTISSVIFLPLRPTYSKNGGLLSVLYHPTSTLIILRSAF